MPEIITNGLFGIGNRQMDALVVTPTVKHHDIAGISGTLKLYACFSGVESPWNYRWRNTLFISLIRMALQVEAWAHAVGCPRTISRFSGSSIFWTWFGLASHLAGLPCSRIVGSLRRRSRSQQIAVAADRVAFDIYLKVGQTLRPDRPGGSRNSGRWRISCGISDLNKIDIRRVTVWQKGSLFSLSRTFAPQSYWLQRLFSARFTTGSTSGWRVAFVSKSRQSLVGR